jgi:hypothetical protein
MKICSRTTGKEVEVKPGPGRSVNSTLAKLANPGEAKLLGFDKTTKVKK